MSMILPTKRLSEPRSLLGMGAIILGELNKPKDLSRLWEDTKNSYRQQDGKVSGAQTFTYEWFVLALDFLFLLDAIWMKEGKICRKRTAVSGSSSRSSIVKPKRNRGSSEENISKNSAAVQISQVSETDVGRVKKVGATQRESTVTGRVAKPRHIQQGR